MALVAVITPYYQEPLEYLRQCHESVLSQGVDVRHYFVADGFPKPELSGWNAAHVVLPTNHADYGNTPRGIGSLLALVEGHEFVAYLDADNWYHPGHLASLLALHEETRAEVCCSLRTFHQADGTEFVGMRESDEVSLDHVDTSCFMLHRSAGEACNVWLRMPRPIACICDRVFKAALHHARYRFAHTRQGTVAYRSLWRAHYAAAGLPPPPGVKQLSGEHETWLRTIEGVRETTKALGFFPF